MSRSEQTKHIKKLLAKWTKVMHLVNWEYEIEYSKKDDKNIFLTIRPCPIYCKALITIWPEFLRKSKDIQEQSIVHELIHCKLEPIALIANDLLDGKLHTRSYIQDTIENITQNFSTILYPLKDRFYVENK